MMMERMTDEQKLFIDELMTEIEEMGYTFVGYETNFANQNYDRYRVYKQEAVEDIDMLIEIRDMMKSGMTFDEAYDIYRQELTDKIVG